MDRICPVRMGTLGSFLLLYVGGSTINNKGNIIDIAFVVESVLLFAVWKIASLDVGYILLHGIGYDAVEIGIAAQEAW